MENFIALTAPGELVRIRDLAAVIWPATFAEILSREQITYMMQMMYAPEVMNAEMDNGVKFELLQIDGTDAGYMVYEKISADCAKLHKLYLLQKFHGRSFGQKMLDHVADLCRRLGCRYLKLNVNKQNSRAIKAYLRNGFTHDHPEINPIGNGFVMDDFVMIKSL